MKFAKRPDRWLRPEDYALVEIAEALWPSARARVMLIEQASFAPSIQGSAAEYDGLIAVPTRIAIGAYVHKAESDLVGFLLAAGLEEFKDIPGVADDPHVDLGDTTYLWSVAVDPDWRRRGLGIALEKECLVQSKLRGRPRVSAHIRHKALTKLGIGGRVIRTYDNWYGTGEKFDYVEFLTTRGRYGRALDRRM
jgi:ribosomal protein S18 acetylase RimI-like enzyme